jgi:hypothetical protein
VPYDPSKPLSPQQAEALINEIGKFADSVIKTTEHTRKGMRERGIVFAELMLILANGKVEAPPEYDEKRAQYRYRVEGPTLDDDLAVAITVILDHRSVCVVTIF